MPWWCPAGGWVSITRQARSQIALHIIGITEENMAILFEPVTIGKLEMKNRFMRSATYYALADDDGFIEDESVALMKTLASNDVGLIITGYAYVQKNGQCFVDMNGIYKEGHIPGFQKMTGAVHDLDGKIVMQIVHGGINATQVSRTGGDWVAVSVKEDSSGEGPTARELTAEDIEIMIDAFGQAARRVQEAGFDGVQIHGAHGYLVTQFLSPQTNRRQDRWGGSLENRMRFVVETYRAMRKQVDDDFPIMIKLGCRDYSQADDRLTIEDGVAAVEALAAEGLCHVEISHGVMTGADGKKASGITTPEQEAYMLPDAQAVRRATDVPLGLVGGIRSLEVMEDMVQSGTVDTISLCRPLIREPDLIKQWASGRSTSADCISCGRCFGRKGDRTVIQCSQLTLKDRNGL